MSFTDELANSKFTLNVVIELDGQTYARFQPDSGITIPDENLIVGAVNLRPFTVDIRDVRSSLPSNTFVLLDVDGLISNRIGASTNQLLNEVVVIKVGFITGSFDFADYRIFSAALTTAVTKQANAYTFSARENQDLTGTIFSDSSVLVVPLNSTQTDEMTLADVTDFADGPAGFVKIDQEFIQYQTRNVAENKLENLTRSDLSSTATAHAANAIVNEAQIIKGNPIDLLLQILISPGGLGPFDVLDNGLGISQDAIDVAGITAIRDANFVGDEYEFVMVDVGAGLSFLEREILQATNTRFLVKEGQTSIALLDQTEIGAIVPTINEDSIIGTPSWKLGTDRTVNRIIIEFNFVAGLNRFTRVNQFDDTDSQTNFGFIKALTFKFKGIQAALDGVNIVQERATRLLARLSTSQTTIAFQTLFSNADLEIGDEILLQHRFLADQGGGLGISDEVEIISRGYDLNRGQIQFSVSYTSFTGSRFGLIAPSSPIVAVNSSTEFDLGVEAAFYETGFVVVINAQVRTIISIVGDVITVNTATTASIGDLVLFADYDLASDGQKAQFAYISQDETGFPSDGGKSYQISF